MAMQDATAQARRGREGGREGGMCTILYSLLYFYVVCTTQMALLQFISSGLPKVSL